MKIIINQLISFIIVFIISGNNVYSQCSNCNPGNSRSFTSNTTITSSVCYQSITLVDDVEITITSGVTLKICEDLAGTSGNKITVNQGGTLIVNGNFEVTNSFSLITEGKVTLGSVSLKNSSSVDVQGTGELIITNDFEADKNATISISAGGKFEIGDKLKVGAGSSIEVNGTLDVAGGLSGTQPTGSTVQYRSKESGVWGVNRTWEYTTNGTNWYSALGAPNAANGKITILNGHKITVTTSVNLDELTVDAGATIVVKNSKYITIENGGDLVDCQVNGTLENEGTINTIGVLAFGINGIYTHSQVAGVLPQATYGNLEIDNNSGVTAAGAISVNGNLTLTSGTFTPGVSLTIAGNFIDNGGVFSHNYGTVTFTGNSSNISGTDNNVVFYNVVVNKTAGQTLSVAGSIGSVTMNDLTITSGTLVAPSTLNISGVMLNNGGVFTHNNSTVILTGSSNILGGTVNNTFYNLTVNGATTFQASQTINNTMVLGAKVTIGNNNLTIGNSGLISGYSILNYVITNGTGKVIQNGIGSGAVAGKKIFPVGISSTSYTPIILDNLGTTDNFSAYVGQHRYSLGTSGNIATQHAVDRTWYINEAVVGGSNVTLTAQWNAADELSDATKSGSAFNRLNCFLSHYTAGAWDSGSQTGSTASGTGPFTISRSGIRSFSPFGVEDPSALPITLIDFTAKSEGKKVRLDWETGSEINNEFFTVERSTDGKLFEKVFIKKGAGNSKSNLYYFGYDSNPYFGVSYYRLKQTDFDGKYAYSDIVSANVVNDPLLSEINVNVYPNPVSNQLFHLDLHVHQDGDYTIHMLNYLGQCVYTLAKHAFVGKNTFEVYLPNLVEGIYVLEIKNKEEVIVNNHKVVVN
jgi:hypothetical protein